MFRLIFIPLLLLSVAPFSICAAEIISIGQFSTGSLHGWEEETFDGKTAYSFVVDAGSDTKVLQAASANSASGLFFKQRIDLNKTPFLHWSWKTASQFKNTNENTKAGDDFVARIYVVIDGGFFFWKTLALNYVWSSSHQTGEKWDNPYTSHATMFAVESGSTNLGQWVSYTRNVKQDLKALIGQDVQYIDAIAIMTDTDNSGLQATTYFGDIYFSNQ